MWRIGCVGGQGWSVCEEMFGRFGCLGFISLVCSRIAG